MNNVTNVIRLMYFFITFVNVMKERLNAILKHLRINASQFADEIGVQRASVSHVLSERNKPGFDFVQKILEAYPSISAEWLITGQGEMLKSKNVDQFLFTTEDTDETKVSNTRQNVKSQSKAKVTEKDINKSIIRERNIEKIIVFYSDKSFSEYFPE
jgi:transcriptional regulator with XRE-family HTH domain